MGHTIEVPIKRIEWWQIVRLLFAIVVHGKAVMVVHTNNIVVNNKGS